MKTIKKFLLAFMVATFGLANLSIFTTVDAAGLDIYNDTVKTTLGWQSAGSLRSAIAKEWDVVINTWADLVNEQMSKLVGYIIDIFIVVWIAVAFIGAYKVMTSDDEKAIKEWTRLLIFGIIWIIIMVSARFFAKELNGFLFDEFSKGWADPKWIRFVDKIYKELLYPFIRIACYFVIWFLFFAMVWKVISFVTSTDDSAKKKAGWVIIRSVVWILIVMWAKQLVESVMWKQTDVLDYGAERIDDQWSTKWGGSVLDFGTIDIITQAVNWVLWLTTVVVLALIIIQWYKIFTKPDDPKTRESLKKTILYIIIWVLIIWAAYAISNVLVINKVPIDALWNNW